MAEKNLEKAKVAEAHLLIQDEHHCGFNARDKMIAVLEREAERVALSKLRLEQGLKIVAAIRERVVLTCSDFLLLEQEADCSLDDVWIDPFDEYERIWAETDLEAAA